MEHQIDSARIGELVVATLVLYAGQTIDTQLLTIAEVMARLLAESSADPDEGLLIVCLATREWLASGKLTVWPDQPTRVQ